MIVLLKKFSDFLSYVDYEILINSLHPVNFSYRLIKEVSIKGNLQISQYISGFFNIHFYHNELL